MSIKNMSTRINFAGGHRQVDRMNRDKLKSLKKAMLYSYQSATVKLADDREFRCLINPDQISNDLDNKFLSIPFFDVCLNDTNEEKQEQEILLGEGDVIEWKENGSHWLIYLRRLEETAYFRAEIRRCKYQVQLSQGSSYWVSVKGPVEQSLSWSQAEGNYLNQLNLSLVMYITKNEETLNYFSRFKKIMLNGKPWEVQNVDSISTPGIIEVSLKETYSNSIEDSKNNVSPEDFLENFGVHGSQIVSPYDTCLYKIDNVSGQSPGKWKIENESKQGILKILEETDYMIRIQILTGKSGSFTVSYYRNGVRTNFMDVKIQSL